VREEKEGRKRENSGFLTTLSCSSASHSLALDEVRGKGLLVIVVSEIVVPGRVDLQCKFSKQGPDAKERNNFFP